MANTVNVSSTNTFEEWRVKTNELGEAIGDLTLINSNTMDGEETIVVTVNNLRTESNNNAIWIGDISTLYVDGGGNLVHAINVADGRLNTKDAEQGAITGLTHYNTYPTLVGTLNSHDARLDVNEHDRGIMANLDPLLLEDITDQTSPHATDLVTAINANTDYIGQIAIAAGITLTTTFADVYDGYVVTGISSVSGALNRDYARLNTINNLIGGTQTDGDTSAFAAADLYGTHTSLVAAINGIEDFVLTNSKWDGTNDKSLIWALNNHESRLDTEENNIDLLQEDVGTWASYDGTAVDITSALNEVKSRQDNLTGDFVNASGDTLTGNMTFTSGGLYASGQYLNIGNGTTNTIRINTSNRVGIGKAAHSSYKVDVSGTLNATDIKIGGESLDNRFLEINEVSGWDEVGAQVKFNNNATFSDEVKMGTEVIYNSDLTFTEKVQDVSGTMFTDNNESGGITAVYSDASGKVTLAIADDGHAHVWSNIDNATRTVQDIAGAMWTGNSESGITVDYKADQTLDINVNDPTITLSGDVTGSAQMTNLGSITIATTIGSNNVTLGDDTTGNYVKSASTSGVGISGSVNSEGGAFTVTSNATSANTASTIVSRSSTGNIAVNNLTCNSIDCNGDLNMTNNRLFWSENTDNASIEFHNTSDGDTNSRLQFNVADNGNEFFQWNNAGLKKMTLEGGNLWTAGDITAGGGDMYATTFHGTATTATYADLAENYVADDEYEVGTVVAFGGAFEVTLATDMDNRIGGVVSTSPAYLMNSQQEGEFVLPIAMAGRVPCKVSGSVKKGDMMVADAFGGARSEADPKMGTVIGKALEDSEGINVIEVVVGKL